MVAAIGSQSTSTALGYAGSSWVFSGVIYGSRRRQLTTWHHACYDSSRASTTKVGANFFALRKLEHWKLEKPRQTPGLLIFHRQVL